MTTTNTVPKTYLDPVCGMTVAPEKAAGMSRVDGKPFYFCSAGCNAKFDADPTRYTGSSPSGSGGSCCGGDGTSRR